MCINIVDAATSVLFVWLLVPKMGVYGYITVIYVSECINTVFSIWKLLSVTDIRPQIMKILFSPVAAAVGSANITYMLLRFMPLSVNAISLIIKCALYIICYFALCAMLGCIGKEERCWVKQVIN